MWVWNRTLIEKEFVRINVIKLNHVNTKKLVIWIKVEFVFKNYYTWFILSWWSLPWWVFVPISPSWGCLWLSFLEIFRQALSILFFWFRKVKYFSEVLRIRFLPSTSIRKCHSHLISPWIHNLWKFKNRSQLYCSWCSCSKISYWLFLRFVDKMSYRIFKKTHADTLKTIC